MRLRVPIVGQERHEVRGGCTWNKTEDNCIVNSNSKTSIIFVVMGSILCLNFYSILTPYAFLV